MTEPKNTETKISQQILFGLTLTATIILCTAGQASAGSTVSISLKNNDLPASDLVAPQSNPPQILSPNQALQLKTQQKTDLSLLQPDATTDEWQQASTASDTTIDQALPVNAGDTLSYTGIVTTSAGQFKFNTLTQSGASISIMLSKNIHTLLLRKELLRRLGYHIPAIKYLPQVKVRFANSLDRDFALITQLPADTRGGAYRWEAPTQGDDPLVVTLQDVVALDSTPLIYNVALGPPTKTVAAGSTQLEPEGPRILRSLALPYGLANVPESINQLDWYVGSVSSDAVTFATPDTANYACSLDDALWMMRRIAALTRDDFTAMVDASAFPPEIAALVVEKMISRRNSMIKLFNLPTAALAFNGTISEAPDVVSGKVIRTTWPGYASLYAYGDTQSPLQNLQYYVISEVASNVMLNLLNEANNALPALNGALTQTGASPSAVEQAIQNWFVTGVAQSVGIGVWIAPVVNGGVNISRDVVLGSYLGTSNLVQLVDTFGFYANAGMMVGVQGLKTVGLSGSVEGSLNISVSHLKPLTNLKDSVTEPIDNLFVPWVLANAAGIFKDVSGDNTSPVGQPTQTPDQLKKKLTDDLNKLDNFLGVHESLILTQSLSATESAAVSLQAPSTVTPAASLQGSANQLVISRLHFYRKDATTIQVFKDNGGLVGLTLAFELAIAAPARFPIISFNATVEGGTANTQIYNVNISQAANNPLVYANANALSTALATGSVEVLNSIQKPAKMAVSFIDTSSTFQLLWYMSNTLTGNGDVLIYLPDGTEGNYISLSEGTQSGNNWQNLATQAATFLVQELTGSGPFTINTNAPPDPGQSFLGNSQTRQAFYQARLDKTLTTPYVGLNYRWEGWDMSSSDMQKLTDSLTQKYGFQLFPNGYLGSTTDIKLYELLLTVNVYETAIKNLMNMDKPHLYGLEWKYGVPGGCYAAANGTKTYRRQSVCGPMSQVVDGLTQFQKGGNDVATQAQLTFQVVDNLEQLISLSDLASLSGGADNIYINATITGFRSGIEIPAGTDLTAPITSNSYGKPDPYNPTGVLSTAQEILGIQDGEFDMQWIRNKL